MKNKLTSIFGSLFAVSGALTQTGNFPVNTFLGKLMVGITGVSGTLFALAAKDFNVSGSADSQK